MVETTKPAAVCYGFESLSDSKQSRYKYHVDAESSLPGMFVPLASKVKMTEHWLDKVPGHFGRDYSLQHHIRSVDAMIVHIVIFDTRRILLLHPTGSDDDDEEMDTGDGPRDGSMTMHSFALHPKIDADMTIRDQALKALSGAIQDGVLSNLQISEYCCNNYLHEIRRHKGDEIGTLHLVVQVTIPPIAEDGTPSHTIQRHTPLTFDTRHPNQYDDAIWLPLPFGTKTLQHRRDIKEANDGTISNGLLTKAIVQQQQDTARGIMKKKFDTVPKMVARLGLMFSACFDIENLRRGNEMGYILAWKHAPYGQMVIFIVMPYVVDKKVQQVDRGGVRYNALFSGMEPDEHFLEDCGMDFNALGMMLGGTVRDDGYFAGGRLLFDWVVEDDSTHIHYERL